MALMLHRSTAARMRSRTSIMFLSFDSLSRGEEGYVARQTCMWLGAGVLTCTELS